MQGGDDIRFVRKDTSEDNAGSECDNAEFNSLSVTSDAPNHGGKVYQCDASHNCLAPIPCSGHDFEASPCSDKGEGIYSSLALDGDVDTVHPLNTTNQERTGTFFVCWKGSGDTDYTFYTTVEIVSVAFKPSPGSCQCW